MGAKRGQITIFIILAIIIVASVVAFLVFRDRIIGKQIPPNIEPVYNSFLTCLEDNALLGINLLGEQAGYISLPDLELGSRYMPFSSQLVFFGNPIPYWYYVSGNNIQKEQIPSKTDMERQLEDFIVSEIKECVFDSYYEQGFEIEQGEARANVLIRDNNVEVNLYEDLSITKEEDSALIRNHKVTIPSKLGSLYDSAKKIYEKEQTDLFLENYTVDVLRLYAPVDGVELTCSPKIWGADSVFDDLQEAIEINTLALKTTGDKDDYFYVNVPVEEDVRFISSQDWPNSFEVAPSEGSILMASPVGNQPGLGVLGFCYVPYHFVYNVKYPVLVQVYDSLSDEIFQFPIAVIIQGNKPREALSGSAVGIGAPELCEYKNTPMTVKTYDTNLNPVEADISYECFGEICNIGETSSGILEEDFPQCVNGYVVVKAEGYKDTKYLYSTNIGSGGSVEIILDRLYEMNVDLKLDGSEYNENAIISFVSDKGSKTIVYPEQKSVDLSEGQYEIQVYIYKNSTVKLESTTKEQCVEVSRSGLLGLLGMTEKKCFDIEIPSQIISQVLAGGGKEDYYILETELKNSNTIEINSESLSLPDSIEQLQDNYLLFEDNGLDVVFK